MTDRKAYQVVPAVMPEAVSIVSAVSRAQAKHLMIAQANEVGFGFSYPDKISVRRRPEYDDWAKHAGEHRVVTVSWVNDWFAAQKVSG